MADDALIQYEAECARLTRALAAAQRTIDVLADASERNGSHAAESLLHQNVALETVVARKTQELERERGRLALANEELRTRYDDLARIELELRHAQKLEAVGRLASGIAHEINTPIQFVSDSLHFVRDAIRDLSSFAQSHDRLRRAVLEGGDVDLAASEATLAYEDADLEYALENVPRALDRAVDGLGRVATIVRSMKAFAHPDGDQKSLVDINDAITSTLVIARHEYTYVADVEVSLGDLPKTHCHAGEVNQVVLNLVVNAAHAIADAVETTGSRGTISVSTRQVDACIEIAVGDTGTGIPEDVQSRIFDPFFTTKEVGRGTGQGLAIARNVIEKHGGTITFETKSGHGTTFFVRIPLHTGNTGKFPEAPDR